MSPTPTPSPRIPCAPPEPVPCTSQAPCSPRAPSPTPTLSPPGSVDASRSIPPRPSTTLTSHSLLPGPPPSSPTAVSLAPRALPCASQSRRSILPDSPSPLPLAVLSFSILNVFKACVTEVFSVFRSLAVKTLFPSPLFFDGATPPKFCNHTFTAISPPSATALTQASCSAT